MSDKSERAEAEFSETGDTVHLLEQMPDVMRERNEIARAYIRDSNEVARVALVGLYPWLPEQVAYIKALESGPEAQRSARQNEGHIQIH